MAETAAGTQRIYEVTDQDGWLVFSGFSEFEQRLHQGRHEGSTASDYLSGAERRHLRAA